MARSLSVRPAASIIVRYGPKVADRCAVVIASANGAGAGRAAGRTVLCGEEGAAGTVPDAAIGTEVGTADDTGTVSTAVTNAELGVISTGSVVSTGIVSVASVVSSVNTVVLDLLSLLRSSRNATIAAAATARRMPTTTSVLRSRRTALAGRTAP